MTPSEKANAIRIQNLVHAQNQNPRQPSSSSRQPRGSSSKPTPSRRPASGSAPKRTQTTLGTLQAPSDGVPQKHQKVDPSPKSGTTSRRRSSNPGRFTCEYCFKEYHSRNPRDAHVATVHRNEKKYPCQICGKAYGLSWNRDTHVSRVHSGEKPYACTLPCKKTGRQCESRFAVRADFERHCRLVHNTIVALYPCGKCGAKFQRLAQMRQHEKGCAGWK